MTDWTADPKGRTRPSWSTRKKDKAPRGVFRHESGVWGTRYTCGAGHVHEERVGTVKSDAVSTYHKRRARAKEAPGWCPAVERQQARSAAKAEQARQMTFRQWAREYVEW